MTIRELDTEIRVLKELGDEMIKELTDDELGIPDEDQEHHERIYELRLEKVKKRWRNTRDRKRVYEWIAETQALPSPRRWGFPK
jgi:hypothetical protein